MPSTVITGRSIAFTYDSVNYDDQIISATVTLDDPTATVQTLNGLVDYLVDKEVGTLTVELLQDWGASGSVCDDIWSDADTNPTTVKTVTIQINSKTMTLSVLPKRPDFGGTAPEALTTTVTMPIRAVSIA